MALEVIDNSWHSIPFKHIDGKVLHWADACGCDQIRVKSKCHEVSLVSDVLVMLVDQMHTLSTPRRVMLGLCQPHPYPPDDSDELAAKDMAKSLISVDSKGDGRDDGAIRRVREWNHAKGHLGTLHKAENIWCDISSSRWAWSTPS